MVWAYLEEERRKINKNIIEGKRRRSKMLGKEEVVVEVRKSGGKCGRAYGRRDHKFNYL